MFTAYQIRVAVHLTDHVTANLARMSHQFGQTHAQALALQQRLERIKLLAATGLMLGGAGVAGLEAMKAIVKPAMDYAHQLNIMNNLGMSQAEIAEAVGAAWKNTGTVITTTATGNLRALVDLRNILADVHQMSDAGRTSKIDMGMALSMLPTLTKLQAVMMASTLPNVANQGKDDKFIYEMAKALDIRGAATDPVRFAREADLMTRAIVGLQGRITPEAFKQAFIFARQEKFLLSDQFLYERGLPTLLLEQSGGTGGGQRGIGPMLAALNRFFVQDIHGKKPTAEAIRLGLFDQSGNSKYAGLALTDPYALATEVVMPAILKDIQGASAANFAKDMKEGMGAADAKTREVTIEMGKLFRGNQLLADIMLRFIHQQVNFIREQQIIQGVLPMDTAYQQSLMKDPNLAFTALAAQWENLKTAFGISVIPILIPAIQKLAEGLNLFAAWARENPSLVQTLTYAFTGLSGALLFSGAVLTLRAAFMGLSTVLTIGGAIGGVGLVAGLSAVATALLAVGAAAVFFAGTPLGKQFFGDWFKTDSRGTKDFRPTRYGAPVPGADTDVFQMPNDPLSLPRPPWHLFSSPPPSISTPSSGDMRERNAVADLTTVISGDMRERQQQDTSFLERLGAIIKEGLAAGLAGVTIKMDGATVGRLLDNRATQDMNRPLRDGGLTAGRNLPLRPADAY